MNRLGEKSLRILEYFTVLDLLAAEASSERGRELCMALRPVTDREEAALWRNRAARRSAASATSSAL